MGTDDLLEALCLQDGFISLMEEEMVPPEGGGTLDKALLEDYAVRCRGVFKARLPGTQNGGGSGTAAATAEDEQRASAIPSSCTLCFSPGSETIDILIGCFTALTLLFSSLVFIRQDYY